MASLVQVPVSKSAGNHIEFDIDSLADKVFKTVIVEGLKVLIAKGMGKITKETYPDDNERKAAALAKATENADALKAGNLKEGRSKANSSKVPAKIMTEALRLAKAVVKDQIRAAGMKISHVKAADITIAAKALIDQQPEFLTQAEANLAARAVVPTGAFDISALVREDATKVAKSEAKKAEAAKNKPLSKAAASKTAPRKAKPAQQPTAH